MEFTRLTRRYIAVDVDVTLWDGSPAVPTAFDAALTARAATVNADTVWIPALYDDEKKVARVLVAGPDAPPGGGLTLGPTGGRLWLRNVDNPESDYFSAAVIRLV